ncbi:MAG: flagellar basal-body rod protein FlgG [Desulfobacteraceae bacterium]|nr:flagellar basal-body rod protein FlgG [Desulfobacteraceae bacterium]
MIRALYTARTGMMGQQLQLDAVSNNLANVNTAGFKKSRVQFEDLFYQEVQAVGVDTVNGNQVPTGIQVGMGSKPAAVEKIFTQGDLAETGNDLDWAIQGPGFFKVVHNGQEYYTRAGMFKRDSDGYIVTSEGDRLQPEFAIPPETATLTIDQDGLLTAKDANQNILASTQVTLFTFMDPAGLESEGGNLYMATPSSGDPIENNPGVKGTGTIMQKYMETSNVDITEELINLITTQRAYEVNSKAIQTADQLMQISNSLKQS